MPSPRKRSAEPESPASKLKRQKAELEVKLIDISTDNIERYAESAEKRLVEVTDRACLAKQAHDEKKEVLQNARSTFERAKEDLASVTTERDEAKKIFSQMKIIKEARNFVKYRDACKTKVADLKWQLSVAELDYYCVQMATDSSLEDHKEIDVDKVLQSQVELDAGHSAEEVRE
ncbi:hypothetical protein F53441_10794 [Fusarium austroafricanum]|uniref:Uncharacterized protein n=1 Tax=Fusarium austroafricanum TaxID=2364996 RepID=A0A8H4K817_9HYPO|nr:hypothetical protein F53441_10794 [Fusarium austroafricanum]